MLSKCANPFCSARFRPGRGRFFRFRRESGDSVLANSHNVKHYWLCEHCCQIFSLVYKPGYGVVLRFAWGELPAEQAPTQLVAS